MDQAGNYPAVGGAVVFINQKKYADTEAEAVSGVCFAMGDYCIAADRYS